MPITKGTPASGGRLPAWLRTPLPTTATYAKTQSLLGELAVHTVCESARCPNHWECWGRGTAAFMIAGDRCTRACKFCAVETARPMPLDPEEPLRVAEACRRMKLGHVVITSVARDDLPDGGADHFRRTIVAVRSLAPKTVIEVLTPDFQGSEPAIEKVLSARPEVFNHNIETVRRLTPRVRSKASYDRSLLVLSVAKAKAGEAVLTKSGLMLGLGETENELLDALGDLRKAGCRALTLGQYLQPSHKHLPVAEFIPPDKFTEYAQKAIEMGFSHVASAPLVRSSYHADQLAKTGHASVLAS